MSNIEIHTGDCLSLMANIPDDSIDLIICDLPYEVTSQNDWDKKLPFNVLWSNYLRIAKDTTPIILFAQGKFTAEVILSNPTDFKYTLVWDKILPSGFLNANKQPLRTHEDIVVFYQKQCTYNPQKTQGDACHTKGNAVGMSSADTTQNNDYGHYNVVETEGNMKYPTSILAFQKPHPSSSVHPTQKPVELLEYLIKTYSNEGDTVLDNCMGAGSTGVACVYTNRNFIGIEMQENYCKIAKERIEAAKYGEGIRKSRSEHKAKALF